jgi:hypothetical protein
MAGHCHGSSDPFNAWCVKITPEINQIIGFARDVLLPTYFMPPFYRRLTGRQIPRISYTPSSKHKGGPGQALIMRIFTEMSEGAALAWLCGRKSCHYL